MEAKEKAYELIDKMHNVDFHDLPDELAMQFKHAKQCALISVNEIIDSHYISLVGVKQKIIDYWQEVKIEIEKL